MRHGDGKLFAASGQPAMRMEMLGANGAVVQVFVANADPGTTGISGTDGDLYVLSNGVSSTLYQHDGTDWVEIVGGGGGLAWGALISAPGAGNIQLNANEIRPMLTGGGENLQMPAAPTDGDEVWVYQIDAGAQATVDGNGKSIADPWKADDFQSSIAIEGDVSLLVGWKYISAFDLWLLLDKVHSEDWNSQAISANYSVVGQREMVTYDGASTISITLPASPRPGQEFEAKEALGNGSGLVTFDGNGNNLETAAGRVAGTEPVQGARAYRRWKWSANNSVWVLLDRQRSDFGTDLAVQTTTATLTTIASYASLANERAISLRVTVWAREAATDDSAKYVIEALFNRDGVGTVTEIDTAFLYTYEDQAAWDVVLAPSGGNILIRVQGEAAKTIEWRCQVEVSEHG